MTKKDYILLIEVIVSLILKLKNNNPQFNSRKFIAVIVKEIE